MTGVSALFETTNSERDPEGLITNFLRYEFNRANRDLHADDMEGRLTDRLKVLFWYLSDYLETRCREYVIPLSAQQIAFLNGPTLIAGMSPSVTIAMYNFVLRDRPTLCDLSNPAVLTEAIYWWCIEKAPSLKIDRALVTTDQVAALQAEDNSASQEFRLNKFMARFFDGCQDLHVLNMDYARDRAGYLSYLVVYSFTNPHIFKYLPRRSVRLLLEEANESSSWLDRILAHYCFQGKQRDDLAAARELLDIGRAMLGAEGLELGGKIDLPTTLKDVGECFLPPAKPIGTCEPGIAVIGPISADSGLGQAMRLSVAILNGCERVAPTVYPYNFDNPAPPKSITAKSFAPYEASRSINLIHINAETIPLIYAYRPLAMLADSYNIGYFFWELNIIPDTHQLALDLVDEIWVASEYNREAYARYTDKPVINVGMAVAIPPEPAADSRTDLAIDADHFVFLSTFDSFSFIERKNPLGVIAAFRLAFPLGTEKTRLVLKTQNRHLVDDPYQVRIWKRIDDHVRLDPRITVINETYSYQKLIDLKRSCDCYVSLHRSEGWGFGIIEAMQIGVPVIATRYSGNMDYCTPQTAYLVDYDLVGVRQEEYQAAPRGSHWAEPSTSSAAAHMRFVVADKADVSRKLEAAQRHIEANFSVAAIRLRYARRLEMIRAAGVL